MGNDREILPEWHDTPRDCLVCGWRALPAIRHRVFLVFVCRNCYIATEDSRRKTNQRMAAFLHDTLGAPGVDRSAELNEVEESINVK